MNNKTKEIKNNLYELILKSTDAKELFIYGNKDITSFFDKEKSEFLKAGFLKNNVKIKQIVNVSKLNTFTNDPNFIKDEINLGYISEDMFKIEGSLIIFEDYVVFYNLEDLNITIGKSFANNQKQLFNNLWVQTKSLKQNFEYKPNHSFYNDFDLHINNTQVIVWPDILARESFKGFNKQQIQEYLENIILNDTYYKDTTYIVAFLWSLNGQKMVDMWKFNIDNYVDDRSGPLGDVRIYQEGKLTSELGLASGNTLTVLGIEEILRRRSEDLKSYLEGQSPKLPLELANGRSLFDENSSK